MRITILELWRRMAQPCFLKIPLLAELPIKCGKVIRDMSIAAHIPAIEKEDTCLRPGRGRKEKHDKTGQSGQSAKDNGGSDFIQNRRLFSLVTIYIKRA